MKKQSFQGALCVLASIVVAVVVMAGMFKNLHWPGGDLLLALVTPFLLMVQAICLSCYVGKYGALNTIEGEARPYAQGLLKAEQLAFIALAIFCVAVIFRICHWPGGAYLVMISCISLAILSLAAGYLACKLYSRK